ncbi:Mitochondrial inner membrane protease subunit 2 [Nymphaea thermarum]|nr:Mitochondrial inner membrane protease subunit 2 [Nymphaea thermarum]
MVSRGLLWFFTKRTATGALIGLTISDRYASIITVHGHSMKPTLNPGSKAFPISISGDLVLVEKLCLNNYKFSHGDVVVFGIMFPFGFGYENFRNPNSHKQSLIKRIIALPGDWIRIPETYEIVKVPEGHCWVEGDNYNSSTDSRSFGPIPLGLVKGRATHVIWPPQRIHKLDRRMPTGRISLI